MKSLTDRFILSNGDKIPCLGFGTWQASDEEAYNSVLQALKAGYRHIDTAAAYGNEESVGRGIKDSGVSRDEIYITTKLWNDTRGYDETMKAFETSLKKLGLDYLDLYLIHWPSPLKFRDNWQEANAESWRAMEELEKRGRIRSLGISNFHEHHYDALMKTATIKPVVNQIRVCPGDYPEEVINYSRKAGMLIEAYSPLGTGEIFDIKEMQELAKKYNKTIAQIALRWSLQKSLLPLPKSVTPSRIAENADVFDFVLSDGDMDIISSIKGGGGEATHPDTADF